MFAQDESRGLTIEHLLAARERIEQTKPVIVYQTYPEVPVSDSSGEPKYFMFPRINLTHLAFPETRMPQAVTPKPPVYMVLLHPDNLPSLQAACQAQNYRLLAREDMPD